MDPDRRLACEWRAAANHNERAAGTPVDMLVLHYTGMESEQGALDWLCREESRVSCHYFVFTDGRIVQSVSETRRAWHAGVSSWRGFSDLNSRSIGIEIANPGHAYCYPDFPAVQMEAVTALCADICARLAIAPRLVLAHSDVAPARKIDPGEKFDWALLARHGIGHWVVPAPARGGRFFQQGDSGQPVEALQAMLALYGYGVEVSGIYDTTTQQAVSAFQRHFRQEKVDGIADVSTIETLHRLLSALP